MNQPLATIIAGVGAIVAALPSAIASEEQSRRATVTPERAQRIAGELFPEKCGDSGSKCGITYDDRRGRPFELAGRSPRR